MASEASNNGPTPAGGSGSDTIPVAADAARADVPGTQLPADSSETIVTTTAAAVAEKWPGWPGDNVFRLIIPVLKVGGIIGRKGELIKKMCEETRARIRVLDAPTGTADRVVLISGKEEPDSQLCPAMDAALKVFKRVTGLSPNDGDKVGSAAMGAGFCCIKLLIASSQAISLIGKQGSTIRSIQESSGASIRVLSEDEVPSYATSDERVVDIQGESMKVLKALEAVLGHLRKFLVDHSVIPIFEKTYNATISQDHAVETKVDRTQSLVQPDSAPPIGTGSDYSFSMMRDPYFINRDARAEPKISHSALSVYGQDPGHGALRSTGLGRMAAPIVTQMTQTMQVPLSYAEDIIGIGGANIAYIRRTSGAILTVQEGRGLPDEITVEIKGTSSQVQMAQQLIQDFISNHKEPASSIYGDIDTGLSSYSQLTDTTYAPSSFQSQPLGGYGSSAGLGGYGSSASMGGYGSSTSIGGYGSSTSIGGYGTSASMGGYGSSSSTSIGGGGYNTYRF